MAFDKVEYQRQYRKDNADKIREYNRKWSQLNTAKRKATRARHYQTHREAIRTKNRLYMRQRRAQLGTSQPTE